jgi:small subunit ribosomal protein S18
MAKDQGQDFFTKYNIKHIDYKDTALLKRFLTPHGRIMPARFSRVSQKNQRKLSEAIKRARFMALLPFIER